MSRWAQLAWHIASNTVWWHSPGGINAWTFIFFS